MRSQPQHHSLLSVWVFRLFPLSAVVLLIALSIGFSPNRVIADDLTQSNEKGLKVFNDHVRGILSHHCLKCHGGESVEAGFNLNDAKGFAAGGNSGPAIDGKNAKSSRLYQRITHAVKPGMPFQGAKLADADIAQLLIWLEAGAPYDRPLSDNDTAPLNTWTEKKVSAEAKQFWSFQKLKPVSPPAVRNGGWCRNPIDRFILEKLEKAGLTPNPPANPATRLRRASFELIGLPPRVQELEALETAEFTPASWQRQIQQFLESQHYGERWGRHWLDVARFAESHGYEHDYDRPTAYTYRDFVIEALNQDLPFDQFVKWQIAGDEIAPGNVLALKATGFLAAGVHSTQITKNEVEKHRYDELDDIVNTIGLSMLGLSVGCARCHDHKFDPIPQRDYYRLVSTFTTTVRSEQDLEIDPEGTARAKSEHAQKLPSLTAKLAAYEAENLGVKFVEWESKNPLNSAGYPWLIAEPSESKSTEGATLTLQPDGAVIAAGKNPQYDTYEFVFPTSLTGIRHLRIEALAMEGLVRQGPGRADNGNFDLTDIKVSIAPKDNAKAAQAVKLTAPRATFEQSGLPIAAAIDDNDRTGWAVDPQFGKDHACAFTFAEPIGFPQGSVLTIKLVFKGNDRHNIGRTRLSVSTAENAPELQAVGLSAAIIQARQTPAAERSSDQKKLLLGWFGSQHDADWQLLNKAINDHHAATPKPQIQKSLISSEGVPALRLHTQGGDFLEQTHFLKRGDPNQKVAVATPGGLQILGTEDGEFSRWHVAPPKDSKLSYRRTVLANWLTDTEHGAGSLLARVIVNRLWQHHFGRGLVATPNDFGLRGSAPSHPELLDWLANELISNGWKLKPIHALIMESATWAQSADFVEEKAAIDRDNQFLWRKPPHRLEAEVIRDSLLSIAGLLDTKQFGPGTLDESTRRRSIYFTVKRSRLVPMLQTFDAPDALSSIGERPTTTVAPQALMLMNNPQTKGAARAFADRVRQLATQDGAKQIDFAYLLALGRHATEDERGDGAAFLVEQTKSYASTGNANPQLAALTDYCHVVLCLNEFVYVE